MPVLVGDETVHVLSFACSALKNQYKFWNARLLDKEKLPITVVCSIKDSHNLGLIVCVQPGIRYTEIRQ